MDRIIDENQLWVCVCIPVRNGAKTIEATLKSIEAQDHKNIKVIICDNNSTDTTKEVIESFAEKTNLPITYILNGNDGSGEQNWNYALSQLPRTFDFYALYHADDIYMPAMISKQIRVMQETEVGAVFCTARLIDESGKDISTENHHNIYLPKEIKDSVFDYQTLLNYTLKYYNFVKAPSFFFRKEILENGFSFDAKFKSSADLDMWLKIAKQYKIAIVNEPLLLYRISKSQGTYLLSKGTETEADFFIVMDYHINQNKLDSKSLKWYRSYRTIDMIRRSVNLCKHDKHKEALNLLNQGLDLRNIPYLLHMSNGLRNFVFGLALKIAIHFNLEKKLITFIGR